MNENNYPQSIFSPNCCLSLATIPVILTLSVVESLSQNLIELGQASEEIFRGSRLPLLHFVETDPYS